MQCLILVFIFWGGKTTQNFESKKALLISIGKQKLCCLHVKQPAIWQKVGFQQSYILIFLFPLFPFGKVATGWYSCQLDAFQLPYRKTSP